jgi:hypothetical protein
MLYILTKLSCPYDNYTTWLIAEAGGQIYEL